MYNTDPDKLPKKPVTISQTSANEEFARWLAQNDRQHLRDAAGTIWNISVESLETPNPADHRQPIWRIIVRICSDVGARHLIADKTLHETQDERLLGLIGDETIRLALKPLLHETQGLDAARTWLAEELKRLREQFASEGFHQVKRQLVGRWIDQSRLFG